MFGTHRTTVGWFSSSSCVGSTGPVRMLSPLWAIATRPFPFPACPSVKCRPYTYVQQLCSTYILRIKYSMCQRHSGKAEQVGWFLRLDRENGPARLSWCPPAKDQTWPDRWDPNRMSHRVTNLILHSERISQDEPPWISEFLSAAHQHGTGIVDHGAVTGPTPMDHPGCGDVSRLSGLTGDFHLSDRSCNTHQMCQMSSCWAGEASTRPRRVPLLGSCPQAPSLQGHARWRGSSQKCTVLGRLASAASAAAPDVPGV